MDVKPTGLNDAPEHVQLAVDLIYLFETNHVDPKLALEALKLVEQDLLTKLDCQNPIETKQ